MKAKWKGDLVDELLENAEELTCHSRFSNGINLQVGNQLIFIGNDQKGCVPFGIHLSIHDFQRLTQQFNREASIERTYLGLRLGQLELEIRNIAIYHNQLRGQNFGVSDESCAKLVQLTQQFAGTGLDFSDLMTAKLFANRSSADYINYYIGRGLGLTPAGDDFTIGLLAVDAVRSFLPIDFRLLLRKAVSEQRTTAVSETYLLSASKGHFSSLVIKVIENLNHSQLDQAIMLLADSGSTSGRDTLAGIFCGLQQIKDSKNTVN